MDVACCKIALRSPPCLVYGFCRPQHTTGVCWGGGLNKYQTGTQHQCGDGHDDPRCAREDSKKRGDGLCSFEMCGGAAAEAPNTCSEGGCQGFFTTFQDACARFCISEEPRRWSAWREVDASYGVRSCQQRERMRIPVKAKARTSAWCALPLSRCCWE